MNSLWKVPVGREDSISSTLNNDSRGKKYPEKKELTLKGLGFKSYKYKNNYCKTSHC